MVQFFFLQSPLSQCIKINEISNQSKPKVAQQFMHLALTTRNCSISIQFMTDVHILSTLLSQQPQANKAFIF